MAVSSKSASDFEKKLCLCGVLTMMSVTREAVEATSSMRPVSWLNTFQTMIKVDSPYWDLPSSSVHDLRDYCNVMSLFSEAVLGYALVDYPE